jgi:hypothetical protein
MPTSAAFFLGAYWGPRPETLEASAARVSRLAESLAQVHQDLGTWCRKGHSLGSAVAPVALTDTSAAAELLAAGQNRRDIGDGVIHELGYRVSVWNGRPEAVELSLTCGAYVNRPTANNVLLKFPPMDVAEPAYGPALYVDAMRSVVESFEPDWATFTTHALRTAQGARPGELTVGWLTYVGRPIAGMAIAETTPLRAGTLLRLGPAPAQVTGEDASTLRRALLAGDGVR